MILAPAIRAQTPLPEPVDQALGAAEARGDLRISFTMQFIWHGTTEITQRYDATTKRWTTLLGDPSDLGRRGRKRLARYMHLESLPGGLLYADYRDSLKQVKLVAQSETTDTYSFVPPQTPDTVTNPQELVDAQLVIERDGGWMRKYSIIALKPYKPNPVSKLDEFVFTQTFARPFADGPALMVEFYCRARGKNLFSTIDDDFLIKFSDFEIID